MRLMHLCLIFLFYIPNFWAECMLSVFLNTNTVRQPVNMTYEINQTSCKTDQSKTGEKPNIIFILLDDVGYADCSINGHPILKTPNIDQLALNGVQFANFRVSPSCSPTRAALMSGKHEFMSGVTHTVSPRRLMSLKTTTIAQFLKSQDYATGLFGKWHLGEVGKYRPEHRGFDVSVTCRGHIQDEHFDPVLEFNGQEKSCKGFREDILFDEAMKFIDTNKDRPFFCYIPTFSAHEPCKCPPEYLKRYNGNAFYGMISNVDDNIGRLMDKLKTSGLDRNTLVVVMNDNGGTVGVDAYNAGMRGVKLTPWLGGTRAFSFWNFPGRFKQQTVNGLTGHVDFFPTIAALSGVKLPDTIANNLEGVNLLPVLEGRKQNTPDRMIFSHNGRWPNGTALRHKYALCSVSWGNYILVHSQPCPEPTCDDACARARKMMNSNKDVYSNNAAFHGFITPGADWALFDISKDLAQKQNIAKENPEIVEKMAKAYDLWWNKCISHLENEQTKGTQTVVD